MTRHPRNFQQALVHQPWLVAGGDGLTVYLLEGDGGTIDDMLQGAPRKTGLNHRAAFSIPSKDVRAGLHLNLTHKRLGEISLKGEDLLAVCFRALLFILARNFISKMSSPLGGIKKRQTTLDAFHRCDACAR